MEFIFFHSCRWKGERKHVVQEMFAVADSNPKALGDPGMNCVSGVQTNQVFSPLSSTAALPSCSTSSENKGRPGEYNLFVRLLSPTVFLFLSDLDSRSMLTHAKASLILYYALAFQFIWQQRFSFCRLSQGVRRSSESDPNKVPYFAPSAHQLWDLVTHAHTQIHLVPSRYFRDWN